MRETVKYLPTPLRVPRKRFRAWLESFDPDAEVGYTGHSRHCPIANCLALEFGLRYPSVCDDVEYDNWSGQNHDYSRIARGLPKWAVRFIAAVDERSDNFDAITAYDALEILSELGG